MSLAWQAPRFDGAFANPRRLVALFCFAALGNAVLALALVRRGSTTSTAIAFLPATVVLLGALVASRRSVLVLGALCTGLTIPVLNRTLPLPVGHAVYFADVLALLALGAWLASRLLGDTQRSSLPASPVLGWPFVLFSLAVLSAALRGHAQYGETLVGQPSRLAFYAVIALAMTQLDTRRLYRGLVIVFYGGAIWMLVNAAYYIASGTAQVDEGALTTGGSRILAQTTAMFLTGSLFLSLLSLEVDRVARRRFLHLAIAGISLFEIVLSFGRTTFAAVALVLPILCFFFRQIRVALVVLLPLFVPVLVLTALLLPRSTPHLKSTFVERVTKSPSQDSSFQWRVKARDAIWPQVKESPLIGVGFGRQTSFTIEQVDKYGFPVAQLRETVTQDAHNSYLGLLAGGGIFCLGSFLLLLLIFVSDAWQRARRAVHKHDRVIVVWSVATAFVFLLNASTGPVLSNSTTLLTIWTLLLLPSVVVPSRRSEAASA